MSAFEPAVIVRLHNGLGNQLFQYAAARALGRRLGVPTRADISGFAKVRDRQSHEARHELPGLGLEMESATAEELRGARAPAWWQAKLGKRAAIPALVQNNGDVPRAAWRAVSAPVYLDGYWQGEEFFAEAREELAESLGRVRPRAASAGWLEAVQAPGVVAVTVRRGDYVTSQRVRQTLGLLTCDYYQRALAELSTRTEVRAAVVFSDDPDWCERELDLGVPYSVCRLDDSLEQFKVAAQAGMLVIGNSTYAWWAAWIASQRGARVVMPARWFVNDRYAAWGAALRVSSWSIA